ncbi:hypothetical protein FFT87_06605 [Salinibacterium sp. M195]|nr:hypothetical protein FFT87_06605 [Salinibacterium sp. M195]
MIVLGFDANFCVSEQQLEVSDQDVGDVVSGAPAGFSGFDPLSAANPPNGIYCVRCWLLSVGVTLLRAMGAKVLGKLPLKFVFRLFSVVS